MIIVKKKNSDGGYDTSAFLHTNFHVSITRLLFFFHKFLIPPPLLHHPHHTYSSLPPTTITTITIPFHSTHNWCLLLYLHSSSSIHLLHPLIISPSSPQGKGGSLEKKERKKGEKEKKGRVTPGAEMSRCVCKKEGEEKKEEEEEKEEGGRDDG